MFSLYRRHEEPTESSPGCRYRNKGVRHIKCDCPVWMDGFDEKGKRQRRSMKTRSWSQAQARVDAITRGHVAPPKSDRVATRRLDAAIASYLADCSARNLEASTITGYTITLRYLGAFFPNASLSRVTLDGLTKFRNSRIIAPGTPAARAVAPSTAAYEILVLRSFFGFCAARKWIVENPAVGLKPPKANRLPTMPFTDTEVTEILAACDRIDNSDPGELVRTRLRARALVLTLLFSGFRISDAVKLERAKIDLSTGRLLVRMMKTGAPLYTRLPPEATEALAALPVESPTYFFWSGKSKLQYALNTARKTIERVLKVAGVTEGHPHRFRDTFSVSLLESGADLRTVQLLLGHTSMRTTEKHYAPFVASTQRILDQAVSGLHFGLPRKALAAASQAPPPGLSADANQRASAERTM